MNILGISKKIWYIALVLGLMVVTSISTYFIFNKNNKFETLSESVLMLNIYDIHDELIATGSGFIVFDKETLVTNYHVIDKGARIEAIDENDVVYSIKSVVASDEEKDLAILKIDGTTNIKPLKLRDTSKLSKGDEVIAIGSPLGLKNTVSMGIISSIREEANEKIIQITAPISSGSSGGALFDKGGKVIGVTFAGFENGENLNLAIPSNEVKKLYDSKDVEMNVKDFLFVKNPKEKYKSECVYVDLKKILYNHGVYHKEKIWTEGYISSLKYSGGKENGMGYLVSSLNEVSNNFDFDLQNERISTMHFFTFDDNLNNVYEGELNVGDHITIYGELFDGHVFYDIYGLEIARPIEIEVK